MTGIRVTHGIDKLAADMAAIIPKARVEMRSKVREGLRAGNALAKDYARRSAGRHGRRYPDAFTTEMNPGRGLFGNVIAGEYGPDSARPQGGMSFEGGSRNSPPHNDLAKSADVIGPVFAHEVGDMADGWFW